MVSLFPHQLDGQRESVGDSETLGMVGVIWMERSRSGIEYLHGADSIFSATLHPPHRSGL